MLTVQVSSLSVLCTGYAESYEGKRLRILNGSEYVYLLHGIGAFGRRCFELLAILGNYGVASFCW